ncbi:hypothetical protein LSAT2_000573 [Lamellibrachia satsuma]|nr:hypothetical protein LSAT2_000573 [Lamellibrachia satsuma]
MHITLQMKLRDLLRTEKRHSFVRGLRSKVDLREHRLFYSDETSECCPTYTALASRTSGINPQGMMVELFHTLNSTQTFYETLCRPSIKDRPCQFIAPEFANSSRCVQQYSYMYALGRVWGKPHNQFSIDFIRVGTGCKCQVDRGHRRRQKQHRIN